MKLFHDYIKKCYMSHVSIYAYDVNYISDVIIYYA